ncbi:winged helix-turn-helix domain-containing protein [Kibdelosporangium philippinense]|uniref:Winged helix-turn-helix domain-containing protein n=1 Tax=Kibdelosporangium philippinense TaxID=211113 RepID=A0ABS8ZLG1_9PSEU|nr:BTAD domain-containing putative transcriptional regulator [Kibdelosporangium philippinense]MCE7007978.1 winged helix-turn-helix domain-containing protein [Kibdelosporangium philippinense]
MRDDVAILLLGPIRLTTQAGPVTVNGGDQRTLLARLATTPGEQVPVHELIEALWGEAFPITAVKTLHSHIARLRRELRTAGLDGLINTDGAGYCLTVAPASVDSVRFETLARMGRRHLNAGDFPQVARTLAEAVKLWRGKPLIGCVQTPWAQAESARLTEVLLAIRENVLAVRAQVEVTALLSELDAAIHDSDPAIDLAGEPPVTAPETISLISRDTDVQEVTWLLANGRMTTLTGVGGVGKSTLAAQVAHCNQSSYPDGVWFAELAALHDFGLVAHTVAAALELHDQSGRSMTTVLTSHFQAKVALLVLDNCEQVAPACAFFVDTLLHAAPDLRILVTSRVPLQIETEQIYDVKPLPVPEPDENDSPAVTLFLQRAPHDFSLTSDNRKAVISLCCRLEGVPLALELAAAQLRELPLPDLVARLDGMIRAKPAVRAIVDFSYELCSPAERLLWRRMSVFEDTFDLVAVENVCAGYNDIPLDTVLDVLDGLVDKAILVRAEAYGPIRFRLPETLRQYGREQLWQAGEQPLVRRRHRNWYLTVAEQREQQWFSPAQTEVAARTRLDHANLRAALQFCLTEPGESPAGLRLAAALWFHWVGNGMLAEAQHWLDWGLSATRQATTDRWKALWVNGYITALQGKTEAARQLLAQVDAEADETSLAHATYALGVTALFEGKHEEAAVLLDEAIGPALGSNLVMAMIARTLVFDSRAETRCREARDICESNGEKWSLAYVLLAQGVVAARKGSPAAAAALARESLRVKESRHDLLGIAAAVGLLALTTGDNTRVATLFGIVSRIQPHVGLRLPSIDEAHHRRAEQVRQALGDTEFDAAYERGASMSLAAAVEFAVS